MQVWGPRTKVRLVGLLFVALKESWAYNVRKAIQGLRSRPVQEGGQIAFSISRLLKQTQQREDHHYPPVSPSHLGRTGQLFDGKRGELGGRNMVGVKGTTEPFAMSTPPSEGDLTTASCWV